MSNEIVLFRNVRAILLGGLLLGLPAQMLEQQPAGQPTVQPTLDQVLTAVHDNFDAYLSSVPNLFADEHVVSSMHGDMMRNNGTKTDSIFRLRRGTTEDHTVDLIESREVRTKRGSAAGRDQELDGPSTATGLFSYGALDLSPDLKLCYDYRLETRQRQLHRTAVLVVDYTRRAGLTAGSQCPITEPVTGRAFVDPVSMQIARVEQRLSQHEIYREKLGVWSWSVDYAPQSLGGKVFWLPRTISSQSSMVDGRHTQWSFVATYRNYHLLTVRSTILPVGAIPAP